MCVEFRDLIQPRTLQRILQQEHRHPGGFLCMYYHYAPVAMHSVVMCTVYILGTISRWVPQCASILLIGLAACILVVPLDSGLYACMALHCLNPSELR